MNFVRTGIQEVRRRIQEQRGKIALSGKRRELQDAEVELGRRGWQVFQHEPAIEGPIARVKQLSAERESLLLQKDAAFQKKEELQRQFAAEQAASQKVLAEIGTERTPKVESLKHVAAEATSREREVATYSKQIRALELEEAQVLRTLSELEAALPPPENAESEKARLGARRLAIPEERAALMAKEETFESELAPLRAERESLRSAIVELDEKIRAEKTRFDAVEREHRESVRQIDAELAGLRKAVAETESAEIQPLSEIGAWLAQHPGDDYHEPKQLVHGLRAAIGALEAEINQLRCRKADPQEWRKFIFVTFSTIALVSLGLLVLVSKPQKREWLPAQTDVIVSVNASKFANAEFSKRWQGNNPKGWGVMWAAMMEPARSVPDVNLQAEIDRITRAVANGTEGSPAIFTLVETERPIVDSVLRLQGKEGVRSESLRGITVLEMNSMAIAPVGPKMVAVGPLAEVQDLVRVRLGLKPDLKINEQFFSKFQRMQKESTFRMISRDPKSLELVTGPLLNRELLKSARLVGLSLRVDGQVSASLLVRAVDPETAAELTQRLQRSPADLLNFEGSDQVMFREAPKILRTSQEIEARFIMPDDAAILFFEKIVKVQVPREVERQQVGNN